MKVPQELKELYRVALVDGVKLESWSDGDSINIWTRGKNLESNQRIWVVLTPGQKPLFVERPTNGIGWKIKENIGVGIINTRAIRKLSCRA